MKAEYALLNNVLNYMQKHGQSHKCVHLSIDENLIKDIHFESGGKFTIEELQKGANICLANEWLQHSYLGTGKYEQLSITPRGLGIARSNQMKLVAEEAESKVISTELSRSRRLSNWVQEHSGLFVLVTILISLAGVLVAL
ncbi:hypothetical protein [Vibrio breoganii]|uniref:hypothetical protein n=1 Tax=Vibrio breoganii TaxID=553239 RepID=UPI000C819930|nr:hypothetical protein [Vibrio breoganii]PMM15849.1 hypothetical protein BCT59_16650 [Vibrio breoganii]